MEEKKELNLNEMEDVTGGVVNKLMLCSHSNKTPTGEQKKENGEMYACVRCDKCGMTFWVKLSDLVSPGSMIK